MAPVLMVPARFDVVVVGGGPAGSSAALFLARAGHRVALLDRATFPRPKICGNCLHPRTWKIWERLDLKDSFSALPHAEIAGFDLQCEGRPLHRINFRRRGPRSISRFVLDEWLLGHARLAGVTFMPGTTVTGVDAEGGSIETSEGSLHARLILGADGRNSLVARQAGLMPPPRRCHRVAWQATLPAPAQLDDHVYLQIFEQGYYGYCRFGENRAVVSMVLDARHGADPAAAVRKYLPQVPSQDWMRLSPVTRAPAGLGRGRVWLAGDAAHVMEPFTGEGMSFALASGLLAAESAASALAQDCIATALEGYVRAHRALYRRGAWVNGISRWMLGEPWRMTRLLRQVPFPRVALSLLARQIQLA